MNLAEARGHTRQEIAGRLSELRTDAQRRRREIQAQTAEARDQLGDWLSGLAAAIDEPQRTRDRIDAGFAERRAERAEARAAEGLELAIYFLGAVEAAVLKAAEARASVEARRRPAPVPQTTVRTDP